MNVGELRAKLAEFEDHYPVLVYSDYYGVEEATTVELELDHDPHAVGVIIS